jgi:hypothetical protein
MSAGFWMRWADERRAGYKNAIDPERAEAQPSRSVELGLII